MSNARHAHDGRETVLANLCSYDPYKGLKGSSSYYIKNAGANTWDLERTEEYAYEADLDYLTSADYGDGLANEKPTWSNDAAGNRGDPTVVDNLNRATTIGGVSRTYDILANTVTKGSVTDTWDCLNRMTALLGFSVECYVILAEDCLQTESDCWQPASEPFTLLNSCGSNRAASLIATQHLAQCSLVPLQLL